MDTREGIRSVKIIENKKRRTDQGQPISPNTEIDMDSEEEDYDNMDQEGIDGSKNVYGAGSEDRARLAL